MKANQKKVATAKIVVWQVGTFSATLESDRALALCRLALPWIGSPQLVVTWAREFDAEWNLADKTETFAGLSGKAPAGDGKLATLLETNARTMAQTYCVRLFLLLLQVERFTKKHPGQFLKDGQFRRWLSTADGSLGDYLNRKEEKASKRKRQASKRAKTPAAKLEAAAMRGGPVESLKVQNAQNNA